MRFLLISTTVLLFAGSLFAQKTSYKKTKLTISLSGKVMPSEIIQDWMPHLQNLEMPKPGTEKANLHQLKREIEKLYPRKTLIKSGKINEQSPPSPILQRNFVANNPNGIPNDNSMAISNDGILISAVNSILYIYDVEQDSLLKKYSLSSFVSKAGLLNDFSISKFDPKLLYDPNEDKFILVFLYGNKWEISMAVACFTETNDPLGTWNCYALEGNPIQDSTWTDYPAIAITEDELFLTLNQLRNDESWRTGFVQSVIWQIDKSEGFKGDSSINTQLWTDILYNGKNIRNLNPIGGGSEPHGPSLYCLSNRNFDIANDSIFIVKVTDTINATSSELKVQVVTSDTKYGVPPFARQANDHEFDTNDSRVLGGFLENDQIQFVNNTLSPDNGFAAVYHGIVDNISTIPQLTSYIITDDSLDFGYPNISYTGKQDCDHESIITFNHSSPNDFAGFSAVYYGNNNVHSEVLKIIEGLSYVDRHSGDSGKVYERWGDYSGTQRKYNEPGKIWTSGYYANDQNENATWVAEIQSPDSTIMAISTIDTIDLSQNGLCHGNAVVNVKEGNPPYIYKWNDPASQTDSIALELCDGSYAVTVIDSYNCQLTGTAEIEHPQKEASVFPNPSSNFVTINFEIDQDQAIDINVYDERGRLVKTFSEASAKKGENLFSFNTEQLSRGLYIVKIQSSFPLKVVAQRFIKL